jgi:hypothetical protein
MTLRQLSIQQGSHGAQNPTQWPSQQEWKVLGAELGAPSSKFSIEALTPSISECDSVGDETFRGTIKVK